MIDLDREAALDAAGDDAGDDLAVIEGLLEARPGAGALGLLARQARLAGAILDGVECHLDLIAGFDFDLAALVLELIERNDGFGLEADVDDDDVGTDIHHQARQDHAGANALIRQALLEHLAETFVKLVHTLSRTSPCLSLPQCLRRPRVRHNNGAASCGANLQSDSKPLASA